MTKTNENGMVPIGRFTKHICPDGSKWVYTGDSKEYDGRWDKKSEIVGLDGSVKAIEVEQRKVLENEDIGGKFHIVKRMTIPVSLFEKNFKKAKTQNIVAEEISTKKEKVNANQTGSLYSDSDSADAGLSKPHPSVVIMTNKEMDEEFENDRRLLREGFTDREVYERIRSDRQKSNRRSHKGSEAFDDSDVYDMIMKSIFDIFSSSRPTRPFRLRWVDSFD